MCKFKMAFKMITQNRSHQNSTRLYKTSCTEMTRTTVLNVLHNATIGLDQCYISWTSYNFVRSRDVLVRLLLLLVGYKTPSFAV